MTREPLSIAPETTVQDAAQMMHDNAISCLPICKDGALVGILTTGDIAGRVVAKGAGPRRRRPR